MPTSGRSFRGGALAACALLLLFVLHACGGGSSSGPASASGPPPVQTVTTPLQTGDGWETAAPTDVGIATQPIVDALNEIARGTYNEIHGLVIARNGKLVLEEYGRGRMYDRNSPTNFGPMMDFGRDRLHILHSVSKVFMSTLTGIAIREGYIGGEDESLLGFFPEHFDPAEPGKGDITLAHLMTMTSGLEWNEWDVPAMDFENNDAMRYQRAADPSAYFFGRPLIHAPGTTFYYNTAGFQMMGEVLRRATAMTVDRFAEEQLFTPMGITDFRWPQYEHGPVYLVGDLFLRPRDMAKFGQLVLDDGIWNGLQLVPADWIERATRDLVSVAHTGYKGFEGYGFHWWRKTFRVSGQSIQGICADGLAGQAIMVFPALDLVVVVTSGNYGQRELEHELVANHILPAVIG